LRSAHNERAEDRAQIVRGGERAWGLISKFNAFIDEFRNACNPQIRKSGDRHTDLTKFNLSFVCRFVARSSIYRIVPYLEFLGVSFFESGCRFFLTLATACAFFPIGNA